MRKKIIQKLQLKFNRTKKLQFTHIYRIEVSMFIEVMTSIFFVIEVIIWIKYSCRSYNYGEIGYRS
jgi:hypothetical protein